MKTDLLLLCVTVFLDVGFGTLEDDSALFLVGLDIRKSAHSRQKLQECKSIASPSTAQPRKMVNKKRQHRPIGLVAVVGRYHHLQNLHFKTENLQTYLLPLFEFSSSLFAGLLLALSLLQQGLRDQDLVLCWHSSVLSRRILG